jgi:hypothetical protein
MIAGTMARKTSRKDVGAWLGGNRGTVQSRMPSVGASSDTEAKVDAGGGQMEQVRAELGLGAYAAGIGTTAAIGAGIAAVRSGAAARGINRLRGDVVGLHGSPVSGLKNIEPRTPIRGPKKGEGAKVYVFRTDQSPVRNRNLANVGKSNTDLADSIELSRKYATGEMGWLKPQTPSGQGSVYVVRTPKKATDLSQDSLNRGILATSSSARAKVVSEIKLANKSPEQVLSEVAKKLKRAGVKVPKKK